MRGARIAAAALILAGAATTAAVAAKPPSGGTIGAGQVFFPNPVATSGNQDLTDQKDAEYAELMAGYETVVLTNLDGSGYLRGDWANIRSETGNPAYSPTNTFVYGRNDDRFEQVMAYYWVTEAQTYIQGLGFGSTYPAVNAESQDLRINQWGLDNSFSWDKHDLIRLGKGGVDDAEDAEVILHEYGHAIHDSQAAGFGTSLEAGSIGEGFGDYWAVTVANVVSGNTYDLPCVADWDAVSYTPAPHCLRRVDRDDLTYPGSLTGSVHRNGQIWSRALWDIRGALGATTADTIILLAQFDFEPDTSFAAAATATVAVAQDFGAAEAAAVQAAFEDRGIL